MVYCKVSKGALCHFYDKSKGKCNFFNGSNKPFKIYKCKKMTYNPNDKIKGGING